jgi:hypothetical protein
MNQQEEKNCTGTRWLTVPQEKGGAIKCGYCMIGYTTNYLMFANAVFTVALSHGTYKLKVYA